MQATLNSLETIVQETETNDAALAELTLGNEDAEELVKAGLEALALLIDNDDPDLDEVTAALERGMAESKGRFNRQLNEFVHDPGYLKHCGSWAALERSVLYSAENEDFERVVLDASIEDIRKDMEAANGDVVSSHLFQVCVRDEFFQWGGQPYLLCALDWQATSSKRDLKLLDHLGRIGSHGHTSFAVDFGPQFLGVKSFEDLPKHPAELNKLLNGVHMKAFHEFREEEHAKYVTLAGPQLMARDLFDPVDNPASGAESFEEVITSTAQVVWMPAAFAISEAVGRSLSTYGWSAGSTGTSNDALILKLGNIPLGGRPQYPLSAVLDELQEPEFTNAGLTVSFGHRTDPGKVVFFNFVTAFEPNASADPKESADRRLPTFLNVVLGGNRYAQFCKSLMREMRGQAFDEDEIRKALQSFLNEYVLPNSNGDPAMKYRYPLKSFSIDNVRAVDGRSGEYVADIQLVPHLNLDAVTVNMKIVTAIDPAPKNGGSNG